MTVSRSEERPSRRAAPWETLWHDLRYAVRGLRRSPAFAAAVVVTLGLGIGANATMFGIVDRLLFRPPAYLRAPDRVHRVYLATTHPREGEESGSSMSYRRYRELAEWARTIDASAAFFYPELAVGTGAEAREMRIGAVSASFWRLFDARPALGRFFGADEDRVPDGTAVAVLGHGYWRAGYGGRPDVLGEEIVIGSRRYTIIGVAPEGFVGTSLTAPAAFIPITAAAGELFGAGGFFASMGGRRPSYHDSHNFTWLEMLVRRTPGVSVGATAADLTSAYRRSHAEHRAAEPTVRPLEQARPRVIAGSVLEERGPNQRQESRVALWLVGVAAIVLLIACANVGNLLLARGFARRREIAVRLALGAGRGRLVRQLVVESILLAALGALAGLALAQWGSGAVRAALVRNMEWTSPFGDGRVLVFTMVVALAASLLAGVAPALHAGRGGIAAALKAGAREGTYQRSRTRLVLLVLQGALSVVLLVGAGLFVRSLQNVRALDLGYDSDRVLYVSLEMRGLSLDSAGTQALRRRLLEHARSLPFVERAARTVAVPFWMSINYTLAVPGIDSVSRLGDFYYHAVSPDYFATMGTRILRGRGFTDADARDAPRVIVVSQSMARTLWPGRDPVGRCVKVGADTVPCSEVVGVAQDIRRSSLTDEDGLQYYVPIEQHAGRGGLFVRTRGDPETRTEPLRRELQRVMPGDAYVTITPLAEILGSETRSWRLGATMFAVFGALALLVAAVGLYSVIAYNVAQRSHELAVRAALGAQGRDIVRLVVGEGARVAALGLTIGLAIALAAGRWVEPLLFRVSPRSPGVLAGVAAVLLAVALVASLIPARRAARADPNAALRAE
jgi:predicted permease